MMMIGTSNSQAYRSKPFISTKYEYLLGFVEHRRVNVRYHSQFLAFTMAESSGDLFALVLKPIKVNEQENQTDALTFCLALPQFCYRSKTSTEKHVTKNLSKNIFFKKFVKECLSKNIRQKILQKHSSKTLVKNICQKICQKIRQGNNTK